MSFHRENVIWKNDQGWFRGFFTVAWTGEDPEWDVEYDTSNFQWVSGPFDTEDQANNSWDGSNPGGFNRVEGPNPETNEYDQMFAKCSEKKNNNQINSFSGWG